MTPFDLPDNSFDMLHALLNPVVRHELYISKLVEDDDRHHYHVDGKNMNLAANVALTLTATGTLADDVGDDHGDSVRSFMQQSKKRDVR